MTYTHSQNIRGNAMSSGSLESESNCLFCVMDVHFFIRNTIQFNILFVLTMI